MPPRESPISLALRWLCVPAAAALCAGRTAIAAPLVADSPFASVAGSGPAATVGTAEAFELAGASVQGTEVSVCIFERQKKRSHWIPVGGDTDGIHVISYDGAHDTAMVTIGGARKQLSMRRSSIASTNPAPQPGRSAQVAVLPEAAPAPIASAPPVTPATAASAASDQREARMLVSDLLEIGVQQRKAYQEAKQKAAAGTPAQPNN